MAINAIGGYFFMSEPKTYSEDRKAFLEAKLTVERRVKDFLSAIEDRKALNVFVRIYEKEALERAVEIDEKLRNNKAGALAGMVIALKDNIAWTGHEINASSQILEGYKPSFSATTVNRLLEQDAIILGHVNCDEFAMGSANEFSKYGRVKNPYDTSRTPGGSSGGPAVAVSAGLCHAALGSDTGGSVRQPSAFCGVFGLKPTYGKVSRYGLVSYASSLDQIGPIANSTDDLKRIMDAIAGPDDKDHTLVSSFHNKTNKSSGKIVGYFKNLLEYEELDTEIKEYFISLLSLMENKGYKVIPLEFPHWNHLLPLYNVISTAEAATNLERYDGIRYGRRVPAEEWQESVRKTRSQGFGPEVKRKIMMGNTVLINNEKQGFYNQAVKVRNLVIRQTENIFEKVDFLISPTTPSVAHKAGEKTEVIERYMADIFTFHANITGIPSVTLPVFIHSCGLPFGLQISGSVFSEDQLLAFSQKIAPLLKKDGC
ncbi:MAG: Asp-tRNA(Asn)/Glu-tRNA(Gln) amidotransferase subunit GatA [Bacteroidales bacterium]|nr:Asp-tRNA(Asn)/Glu-tRNA(Gln) amidotransferase subunit GatA [Bacteroidales bacterium]